MMASIKKKRPGEPGMQVHPAASVFLILSLVASPLPKSVYRICRTIPS
jgi:hypothetical protein